MNNLQGDRGSKGHGSVLVGSAGLDREVSVRRKRDWIKMEINYQHNPGLSQFTNCEWG